MEVQKIIESKDNLIKFLKEKGLEEEKDFFDEEYKEATYLKTKEGHLITIYELNSEEKIKEIKDHFLIDKESKYCIIIYKKKITFYRASGETKHFIYSEKTKNNRSKIDKLENIGTSIDLLFQSKDISARFYEGFKQKRKLLAQQIENKLSPTEKYLIAQKIFDRLFFIYFLCHKGIIKSENKRKISGEALFRIILLEKKNFLEKLKELFQLFNSTEENIFKIGDHRIVVPYLNGGLFRPDVLEQDLKISLTNKQWEEIFEFLNSYHWIIEDVKAEEEYEEKILTPEILGHVYERSVVEWEQKGFEKEAEEAVKKISERKKKGVYYTPESITDYISKNTIIPYLLDKLDNKYSSFEELIKSKNKKDMKKALKILDEIKVLDPACGSGAFLIKAAEILFILKRRLYYELKEKKDFYNMKLDIITENIYGVDILQGAIEISKLRLWLWLISEYEESKNEIKALPNIEYNLKVGNSLIGWLDEDLKQMPINTPLTEKVDGIFIGLIAFSESEYAKDLKKARKLLKKYKLDNYIEAYYILYKIYRRIHGLKAENLRNILKTIRQSIYSAVTPAFLDYVNRKIKSKYDPKNPPITKEEFNKLQVFHWKIDFGHIMKQGGFDVVIGNPPYGNILRSIEKEIIQKALEFFIVKTDERGKGTNNAAAIFIERAKSLLNKGSYFSFIIPKAILYIENWQKVRNLLLEQIELKRAVDNSKAFRDVLLEMATIIFKNEKPKSKKIIVHNLYLYNYEKYSTEPYLIDKKYLTDERFITEIDNVRESILKKIKSKSVELKEISYNQRGLSINNKVIDSKSSNFIEILKGKDIQRYFIRSKHYIDKKYVSDFRPARLQFQEILAHIENPYPHIKITGTYLEKPFLNINTITNLYLENKDYSEKFILSILHSKLINWFVYKYIYINSIRTMHFSGNYLNSIPVPKISLSQQKSFIDLVDQILLITKSKDYLQNKQKQSKVKELQDKIDKMVYKLYGLTEDEIKIVEGNS